MIGLMYNFLRCDESDLRTRIGDFSIPLLTQILKQSSVCFHPPDGSLAMLAHDGVLRSRSSLTHALDCTAIAAWTSDPIRPLGRIYAPTPIAASERASERARPTAAAACLHARAHLDAMLPKALQTSYNDQMSSSSSGITAASRSRTAHPSVSGTLAGWI